MNEQKIFKVWATVCTILLLIIGGAVANNYIEKAMNESFQTVEKYGFQMGNKASYKKGYNQASQDINTNILNNIVKNGEMTAVIPYTQDGENKTLKIIIYKVEQ